MSPKTKVQPSVQVKLRLRPGLLKKLRMDAVERGVSLAAEIEERLERTYDRSGLLYEVMALAYGESWAMMMSEAERHKLLKLRDADKAILKKAFELFLDTVGKAGQK
jgi:hypothetical protein